MTDTPAELRDGRQPLIALVGLAVAKIVDDLDVLPAHDEPDRIHMALLVF